MPEETINYIDFEIYKQKSNGFDLYQERVALVQRIEELDRKIDEILAFVDKLQERKDQNKENEDSISTNTESSDLQKSKSKSIGPKVEKNKK